MNRHEAEFSKLLNKMSTHRRVYDSFLDFVTMTFLAMRQAEVCFATGKTCPEMEEEYMKCVARVGADKVKEYVPPMVGALCSGLEESPSDFLGEVFMSNDLGNSHNGQFFTPYHLSMASAQLTIHDIQPKENYRTTVNDPACGSSGMLIAAFEVMKEKGFKQNQIFMVAQDIDKVCCMMSYIHLTLMDVPATIIWGNTLSLETYDSWTTIGYLRCPFPRPIFGGNEAVKVKAVRKRTRSTTKAVRKRTRA